MRTLWRMLNFGLQNFWRNIWLSLITVLILVLNLFLMSLVFGLNILGQQTLTAVKNKVDVSVYFTATTSEDRAREVRLELLKKPEVETITVVTRAERLEDFKRRSDKQTQGVIDDALDTLGENPFGPGLVVRAKSLDGYGAILKAIQAPEYKPIVEEVGNSFENKERDINKLNRIVATVRRASIGLTVLFALIALLMVFNTIRIAIYVQREEIGIMKLVGASDAFIRVPFIVTSFIYGLLASLLTILLFVPLVSRINPTLTAFYGGYDINLLGYISQHWLPLLAAEIALGCGLAAVSSLFAIGRYLRV